MVKIMLDMNENQYGPSPKCFNILKNSTMEMFNSYSRNYPEKIREKLAEKFNLTPEKVLVGYGSEDILKQAISFSLKRGNSCIAVPDKSWWYFKALGKEFNSDVVEYKMIEGKDSYDYDDELLLNTLHEHKPAAVIICSPNNPTGNMITEDRIKNILKNKPKETFVILDEAYWGFSKISFDEKLVEEFSDLIILRTFSKFYALAGIRIGFAFFGSDFKSLRVYNNRYLGYNSLSEEITCAALESDDYYKEVAEKIINDGVFLFNEFKKMGFKPYKTSANFILAKLPHDVFEFLKEELPKKSIYIKFFNEKIFKDCVRVSIGTIEHNILLVNTIRTLIEDKMSNIKGETI